MREKIKLFVMDVDGTLTDGKIYMGNQGEVFKAFDVRDGYAINNILRRYGVKTAIITGRRSKIVENRSKELKIDFLYQDIKDKLSVLQELSNQLAVSFEQIVYMGDDVADLECMKRCKYSACPVDAVSEIKANSKYICKAEGGRGAVREYVEYLTEFLENVL